MNGVPFFAFVNNKTFGVAISSSTKVLWLLLVISIDLSVYNLLAAFFKFLGSKVSPIGMSEVGIGKVGYSLIVGNYVIYSLSHNALNSSQSREPILKMPLLSVANFSYSDLIASDFPSEAV